MRNTHWMIGAVMLAALAGYAMASDVVPTIKWDVHDQNRPRPQIVEPGELSTQEKVGSAPSDAIVLFDGKNLDAFEKRGGDGKPGWKIEDDGTLRVIPKSGDLWTKQEFGDCQLHVEYQTFVGSPGTGQRKSNSGIFFHGTYEVQVLDSFDNDTYPDGQAGSVYGQYPPRVNASGPTGTWQIYDIIYHRPRWDDSGKLIAPARMTVWHNGVLVQDDVELVGPTSHKKRSPYRKHEDRGAIKFQDHKDDPIRFRNIWVRDLEPVTETRPGDVPEMKWDIHSMERPRPEKVSPAVQPRDGKPGEPPSDAVVLFDGKDLSKWTGKDDTASWKVENGYAEVNGTGSIRTREAFGDCQLHVEFQCPTDGKAGNSGVYLMGRYEVQVFNSYKDATKIYPDGQNGALYGQWPPLVNASKAPGEWQAYDIIFHRPRFDDDGNVTKPARFTVLHNGVLIHDHVALTGPTTHKARPPYAKHPDKLPISLQDHGHPVRYRNIWIRELE